MQILNINPTGCAVDITANVWYNDFRQNYKINSLYEKYAKIIRIKRRLIMNILIVNGSPKGKYSITLQTLLYLQKLNPNHQYEILHAAQRIKSLEKDFSSVIEMVKKADLILLNLSVAKCQMTI